MVANMPTTRFWGIGLKDVLAVLVLSLIPLFFAFLSLLPVTLAYTLSPHFLEIYRNNLFIIILFFYSLVGVFYIKNVRRYLVIIFIVLLVSCALATIFYIVGAATFLKPLSAASEPDLSFLLYVFVIIALPINIIGGGLISLLIIKLYDFFIGKRVSFGFNKIILAVIFILLFVTISFRFVVSLQSAGTSGNETDKKTVFIKRIAIAIGKNQLKVFSNQELIDLGLVSGIYSSDRGRITHSYGGDLSILRDNDNTVHLIYKNIPAGDACFKFYYLNDPAMFGFDTTKIDGVVEQYSKTSTFAIDAFKNKVCNSGKDFVTIEFIGSLEKIAQTSKYFINDSSQSAVGSE